MPVIESFQEFKERQGCRCVPSRGRHVFENGAVSDADKIHLEPSSNAKLRLSVQKEFFQKQLADELKAYQDFDAHCRQLEANHARYSNLPSGPADAQEQLAQGAQRIEVLRERLAEIEERLKDPKRERMNSEREALGLKRHW